MFTSFPTSMRLARAGELNPRVAYSVGFIILSVLIVQILATIGIMKPSVGTYYIGTLLLLFLSATSFARLVALCILPQNKSV